MRRSEARTLFMQLLYQMEVQDDYGQEIKERFIREKMEGSDQQNYFDGLYQAIFAHRQEIDERLAKSSANWKLSRIAKVDLAILRLSAAEILYMDDIPDSASINEAVDLAKKFGGEDSGKFVNGILGNLVRGKHEEYGKE